MKLLMPLALFLPSVAIADCPTNHASEYSSYGYYEFQNSGPTWNLGAFNYNLLVGSFGVSGGGGGGEQSSGSSMSVSDVYQIVGPASATPIPFSVLVHLSGNLTASTYTYPYIGTICNGVSADVTVSSAPASATFNGSSSSSPCASVDVNHDMSIALQKLPDEAFTLSFSVRVYGSSGGSVNGTFAFGLPAGYSVTSCQGYASAPVPASPTSWGAVKATYR